MTVAKNDLSNSQIKMFNEGTTGCQKLPVSVTKHPSAREKKPLVPRGSDRVASYRGSKSLTQKERHRKLCRTPRASIDLGRFKLLCEKIFQGEIGWNSFFFIVNKRVKHFTYNFKGKLVKENSLFSNPPHTFARPTNFA